MARYFAQANAKRLGQKRIRQLSLTGAPLPMIQARAHSTRRRVVAPTDDPGRRSDDALGCICFRALPQLACRAVTWQCASEPTTALKTGARPVGEANRNWLGHTSVA